MPPSYSAFVFFIVTENIDFHTHASLEKKWGTAGVSCGKSDNVWMAKMQKSVKNETGFPAARKKCCKGRTAGQKRRWFSVNFSSIQNYEWVWKKVSHISHQNTCNFLLEFFFMIFFWRAQIGGELFFGIAWKHVPSDDSSYQSISWECEVVLQQGIIYFLSGQMGLSWVKSGKS